MYGIKKFAARFGWFICFFFCILVLDYVFVNEASGKHSKANVIAFSGVYSFVKFNFHRL